MPTLRRCTGTLVTLLSFTKTSPDVGRISPAIMRRHVVLPHPLGPSSATIWPGSIVSDTSSTATVRLYSLLRRSSLTSEDFMAASSAREYLIVALQPGAAARNDELPVRREQPEICRLGVGISEELRRLRLEVDAADRRGSQ